MYNVFNNQYGYNNLYPTQQVSVVQVNGINGANSYQIAPNSSVLLLDEVLPIVYLKQTDGAGYPTIQTFDLVPHKNQTEINIEDINSRLLALEAQINEQSFEQQSIKSDKSSNELTSSNKANERSKK